MKIIFEVYPAYERHETGEISSWQYVQKYLLSDPKISNIILNIIQ